MRKQASPTSSSASRRPSPTSNPCRARRSTDEEDATVTLTTPGGSFDFTGRSYALNFVLPNFFFHVTTAYAILRHKGVPIGKLDYLGGI